MASGIVMRKTAGLLDDKWEDPAVVVVDEALTWAIPITGGHHGANQVADDLASMGAVPAMTTASEAAGKQGVESKAKALDSHVVNGDSTVATNLAVLDDGLGPVARLDGPKAVLVGDDVTVLKRNGDDGVVLGTRTVSGVDTEQVVDAWDRADRGRTGLRRRRLRRHRHAQSGRRRPVRGRQELDLGVVLFEGGPRGSSKGRRRRARRNSSAGRVSRRRAPSPAVATTNCSRRRNGTTRPSPSRWGGKMPEYDP